MKKEEVQKAVSQETFVPVSNPASSESDAAFVNRTDPDHGTRHYPYIVAAVVTVLVAALCAFSVFRSPKAPPDKADDAEQSAGYDSAVEADGEIRRDAVEDEDASDTAAAESLRVAEAQNISAALTDPEALSNIFRFDVFNDTLVHSLLEESPSNDPSGVRTTILRIYAPTRVYTDDSSFLVRINRYTADVTFRGTYAETLRDYGDSCDHILTAEEYPICVAVGIKKADGTDITDEEVSAIQSTFHMKCAEPLPQYASVSMFETIGVAGDSWTAGTVYNEENTKNVTRSGQGWAENLARQNGIRCFNFALGGTSIRTWYNADHEKGGLKGLLASDAVGLYILSFGGSNDWKEEGSSSVRGWYNGDDDPAETDQYYWGSIGDISEYDDYRDYPLTFYGYYGRIIEQIQIHAPDSMIILTSPNTYPISRQRCVDAYTAVQEIAQHYGLPYLDLRNDQYFQYWQSGEMLNGKHPTAAAYSGMGMAMNRLISKCISDNWQYFRDYLGQLRTVPLEWAPLVKGSSTARDPSPDNRTQSENNPGSGKGSSIYPLKIGSYTARSQGACLNGDSFIWLIYTKDHKINKYSMNVNSGIAGVETLPVDEDVLNHCNGITYNPAEGCYYVATMLPEQGIVKLDSGFNYVASFNLEDENSNPILVMGIAYDRKNNKYIISGDKSNYGLYIFDASWNLESTLPVDLSKEHGSLQDVETDGTFIYRCAVGRIDGVMHSWLRTYLYDGTFIEEVDVYHLVGEEMEGLAYDWNSGVFFAHTNSKDVTRTNVYLISPNQMAYHGADMALWQMRQEDEGA